MIHLARTLLVLCAACGLFFGCAHPYAPPPDSRLSAESLLPLQAGNDAARRGDWNTATAQFEQARVFSQRSHLPLYGLATAYDRMGGRDVISLAYYRAYLVLLPAGQPEEIALVLGRTDELEKQIVAQTERLASEARQMIDAIPQDIWRDRLNNRSKMLKRLEEAVRKANEPPPPRNAHRGHRGQPSELAHLEAESWISLAEQFKSSPFLSDPAKALRAADSSWPEQIANTVCVLVSSEVGALSQLRDLERQWQAKWRLVSPD